MTALLRHVRQVRDLRRHLRQVKQVGCGIAAGLRHVRQVRYKDSMLGVWIISCCGSNVVGASTS